MRALPVVAVVVLVGCGHAAAPPPSNVSAGSAVPPLMPECAPATEAAQRALYTKVTGKPYVTAEQDFYGETCLGASPTFPGLLTTGSFATEVGCRWTTDSPDDQPWIGAIYDCTLHRTSTEVAATAMARANWAHADAAQRAKLALAWVTEVEHFSPIESKPTDTPWPDGLTYTPVAARAESNGGVTVEFWIALPRMDPGISVSEIEVVFSPAGMPAEPITEHTGSRDDAQP